MPSPKNWGDSVFEKGHFHIISGNPIVSFCKLMGTYTGVLYN